MSTKIDLTKSAPRSPRIRLGGYAILARTIDKGHASLEGTIGEYNFDCPLDNVLFDFKGIKGSDLLDFIRTGADDAAIAAWVSAHGIPKTAQEIQAWSDSVEKQSLIGVPEKREWFSGACKEVGLNPETASLFDLLEADDKASFA